MRTPSLRVTLALLGTAAVLAGCGGEPDPVLDKDAILRLKLDDYRITPQNVTVRATTDPMRIKIVAENVGRLTHTVKVERLEPDEAEPDESVVVEPATTTVIGGTGNAAPGETVRSDDIFLAPGEYRLTDTIGNHENLGQYGTLRVEPPPGS